MKSLFSQSALVFPQFWVFEVILRLSGKIFKFLKALFVPFIVLKTIALIPQFQCITRFEKRTTLGQDIWEKQNGVRVWFGVPCLKTFLQIFQSGWFVLKQILVLEPWYQYVFFSRIQGTNGENKIKKIVHVHQPQQGLCRIWKMGQCKNWKANLRIWELAKASNVENWSSQLVCLADPFSLSIFLIHLAELSCWLYVHIS